MHRAQIHITTQKGAIAIELEGLERYLPAASMTLGSLDDTPAIPAAAWAPLKWAMANRLGGLVNPVSWMERAQVCVRIDETAPPAQGLRRFAVELQAISGDTPLAMTGTAEVPSWLLKVARFAMAGAAGSCEPVAASA